MNRTYLVTIIINITHPDNNRHGSDIPSLLAVIILISVLLSLLFLATMSRKSVHSKVNSEKQAYQN